MNKDTIWIIHPEDNEIIRCEWDCDNICDYCLQEGEDLALWLSALEWEHGEVERFYSIEEAEERLKEILN